MFLEIFNSPWWGTLAKCDYIPTLYPTLKQNFSEQPNVSHDTEDDNGNCNAEVSDNEEPRKFFRTVWKF